MVPGTTALPISIMSARLAMNTAPNAQDPPTSNAQFAPIPPQMHPSYTTWTSTQLSAILHARLANLLTQLSPMYVWLVIQLVFDVMSPRQLATSAVSTISWISRTTTAPHSVRMANTMTPSSPPTTTTADYAHKGAWPALVQA